MQVMSKVHSDKFEYFGGSHAALDPLANIKVGALVLKDCIARGGSVAGGLRFYVGSQHAGRRRLRRQGAGRAHASARRRARPQCADQHAASAGANRAPKQVLALRRPTDKRVHVTLDGAADPRRSAATPAKAPDAEQRRRQHEARGIGGVGRLKGSETSLVRTKRTPLGVLLFAVVGARVRRFSAGTASPAARPLLRASDTRSRTTTRMYSFGACNAEIGARHEHDARVVQHRPGQRVAVARRRMRDAAACRRRRRTRRRASPARRSRAIRSAGTMKSRRALNSSAAALRRSASVSGSKQASAACCASADAQMNRFCASFSTAPTSAGGTTSQPRRQPVMLKYFEKLLTVITSSPSDERRAPGFAS